MSVVKHTANEEQPSSANTDIYEQWPTDFFKGLADMKEARAIVTTALSHAEQPDHPSSSLDAQLEQDRLELEALSLQQRSDQKIAIVIDANVLIKQIRLQDVLGASDSDEFGEKYEVHTIKEVIREIRDDNARTFMQGLPYELVVHEYVEEEFMDRVRAFAKETGDFKTLRAPWPPGTRGGW